MNTKTGLFWWIDQLKYSTQRLLQAMYIAFIKLVYSYSMFYFYTHSNKTWYYTKIYCAALCVYTSLFTLIT